MFGMENGDDMYLKTVCHVKVESLVSYFVTNKELLKYVSM